MTITYLCDISSPTHIYNLSRYVSITTATLWIGVIVIRDKFSAVRTSAVTWFTMVYYFVEHWV